MRKARSCPPRATQKPAEAAAGVPFVRKFMVKLFDREDGKAADWSLIAETPPPAAFDASTSRPTIPALTLLRRVNAGSCDRLSGNPAENNQEMGRAQNQAADSFNVKSSQPGHADAPESTV